MIDGEVPIWFKLCFVDLILLTKTSAGIVEKVAKKTNIIFQNQACEIYERILYFQKVLPAFRYNCMSIYITF